MSSIVLMRAFENIPGRYDLGMRLITLGLIDFVHKKIAESVPQGWDVLDIGCGTGKLSVLLANRGATVTAIDKCPRMAEMTSARASSEGLSKSVSVHQKTAMEADTSFENAQFEAVILSLVISELTIDERNWVLRQCERILKPCGILLLADEFCPESFIKRMAFLVLRFPFHLAAYLYTQIKSMMTSNIWWKLYYALVELPLMLISFLVGAPMTVPLEQIEKSLPTGLRVAEAVAFGVGGSIRLLKIEKIQG
jgi:ubiquinone/menaquinone biosynthesis C-methylase UbiE